MARYTLSDFNTILENYNSLQLPEETIEIINNLAKKVGAPEYIKTPLFKNKIMAANINTNRRKKKGTEFNNNEWESIRSFKTTEFKNKNDSENTSNLIRKYLNMITNNTYQKLKDNIIKELKTVDSTTNDSTTDDSTTDDLNNRCNEIFKIIIENTLYSDIYAKLYKDLINEFAIFNDILFEKFKDFELLFKTIEYNDPEKDYNKFCENNKNNEIRRSTCVFYINLMKENIIDEKQIGKIILNLFDYLNELISMKIKKNIIDEISELLYIMIINSYNHLNKSNKEISNMIYNNIIKITQMKCKDESGITNKCIFKHMDILDEIS